VALLLTKLGRVEIARSFYRDVNSENDYFHFSLGKTGAWDDDEAPPTPVDSETFTRDYRRNILFTQLITSANVCHLARRIDWVSGTVYDSYDDDYSSTRPSNSEATTLADANFYVITDENKVYKCIDNNSNAAVSQKPTDTSTNTFSTTDGYTWKFLFQVSAADETAFLGSEHIPVRKLTGNPTHDVNGELDSVTVTAGGSGYTSAPTVNIIGDGKGASATATITGDAVTSITLDTQGSGYTFALARISGGGGTGAEATIALGDADALPALQQAVETAAVKGTVDKIEITNAGQGYTPDDVTVTITGDGTGAVATATIAPDTGAITAIEVTDRGTGYTFANVSFTQAVGSGTNAVARAIVSPINGHGSNPVKELFASSIGVVVSISENTNEDLILDNDFRQIGLIKNLRDSSEAIWTNNTATASYVIDVADNSNYAVDDNITTDDGGQFTVSHIAETDSGTYSIYLQPIIGLITASSTLANTTKSLTGLSINSVTSPEIDVTSGDIVYVENKSPINRSSDQVETIKTVLNF
jgi:hypothetical protein